MGFSDFVWLLFGAPLEKCFYILYSLLYTVTSNYGISLLLLSVLTSCLMLPLEGKVKGLVEEERELQKVLTPQLKKINKEYSGEQKHLAIKRLYKRYGYNPLFSIRSALSFFVQLPFLLGAYWMLTNLTSLDGVKFLFIKDLSKPDGLLFGFNLLPILMTVINIGTAFAQVSTRRDKIQAFFIAVLFFVLLYSANSALLIYWTFNNFIGLCKALYIRFKHHFQIGRDKLSFSILNVKSLFIWLAFFLSVAFIVMSRSHLTPDKIKWVFYDGAHFINLSLIVYLGFQLGKKLLTENQKKSNLYKFFLILLGSVLAVTLLKIFGCLIGREYRFVYSQSFICIFVLITFIYLEKIKKLAFLSWKDLTIVSHWDLLQPVVFLLSLIFLTFPFFLYFSDPEAFLADPYCVVKDQVIGFLGWCLLSLLIFSFFKGRTLTLFYIFFSAVALAVVLYLSLASQDLGLFINFKFTEEALMEKKSGNAIYIFLLLISFTIIIVCAYLKKLILVKGICSIFLITSIGSSIFSILQFKNQESQTPTVASNLASIDSIPENAKKFLTFSKNGKNILVIMLDSFSGRDMEKILTFDPTLGEKFTGFTFYSDTLSVGNTTITGKASLLGGTEATAAGLNRMAGASLEEKVNKLWDVFFSKLVTLKFNIGIWDLNYVVWLNTYFLSELTRQHLFVNYEKDFFIKDWEIRNNYHDSVDKASISGFLTIYGLFKISPNKVKKIIYQNGKWLNLLSKTNPEKSRIKGDIALLETLPRFVRVEEDSKNSFKFYTNTLTHYSWMLDSKCRPVDRYTPLPEEKKRVQDWNPRLQTAYCSLLQISKLISKLRVLGVYENTSIAIISDHGNHVRGYPKPFERPMNETLEHLSPLLMFKQFYSPENFLKIDNLSLMMNSDLPDLILNQFTSETERKREPWKDKERERQIYVGHWDRKHHGKDHMKIMEEYKVRGPAYTLTNWERISEGK